MGCDIHLVTEIKKEGKWSYVPEIPEELDHRNYGTFAFLASDVRNSFDTKGFAPRGLPEDISGKKFRFESESPYHHRRYDEDSDVYLLTQDGRYHRTYGEKACATQVEISEEEYKNLKNLEFNERYLSPGWCATGNTKTYRVYDAYSVGGKWVKVPNKDVYTTFEEFEKDVWGDDDWDETAQDYGYWKVDFDSPDYHTPSWLSLKDFLDADYTDYTAHKYKMDRGFYEKFKENGGVMPDCFTVEEKSCVGDIADAFREALMPTVLVSWQMSEEEKSHLVLFKGIEELKEIAKKYEIENPEDIRIVFAFDN